MTPPVDTSGLLATLKGFQRRTAEYAFRRMYLDDPPARRFLVADEVGLGKTMVARGIVARAIEHLWAKDINRIDVLYVCSNHDIARQNIRRLGVGGLAEHAVASRITMLPLRLKGLGRERINLISFTPSTSFDLATSTGMAKERALLACLLRHAWSDGPTETRLLNVLHVDRKRDWFERYDYAPVCRELGEPDATLLARFTAALEHRNLRQKFDEVAESFFHRRQSSRLPEALRLARYRLIGELRRTLAGVCLELLEPDLIILDEFQRFPRLLDGTTSAGELAHQLFDYSDEHTEARVLLLSATPYKMYTLSEESEQEDHYADFMRTNAFLFGGDEDRIRELRAALESYRLALYEARNAGGVARLDESRRGVEALLRQVMVRNERAAMCADPDVMVETIPAEPMNLAARDLESYLALQKTADIVHQPDMIEFWKSAAYPINFMTGYRVRKLVDEALDAPDTKDRLWSTFDAHREALLPADELARLGPVEINNPRLRWLLDLVADTKLDSVPWIVPTLPYYQLTGPFAAADLLRMTKLLVFSGWRVVPRSVSSLVSYLHRRQLLGGEDAARSALNRKQQLLRFALRREGDEDKTLGLKLVQWLYPSVALAEAVDPLRLAGDIPTDGGALPADADGTPTDGGGSLPSFDDALAASRSRVRGLLRCAVDRFGSESGDPGVWRWAGPMLIDAVRDEGRVREWLASRSAIDVWSDPGAPGDAATRAALGELRGVLDGRTPGLLDEELFEQTVDLLALVSMGSPAVCALRALGRLSPSAPPVDAMSRAATIATGFRALFNQPEVIAMVRSSGVEERASYLRRSLAYCTAGCLQSVLDEYVHIIRESMGGMDHGGSEVLDAIAATIVSAVSLPSAQLAAQTFESTSPSSGVVGENRFQCRMCLPFGTLADQLEDATRSNRLREAFNSPFWPFVLVSTSIGQEGLDFHWYCHAVVHWNLPANPIDVEQREGRVHRYKGHAIRKNAVRRHGMAGLQAAVPETPPPGAPVPGGGPALGGADPWDVIFDRAAADRCAADTDLVPCWIYPSSPESGDARVRRYVPHLAMSREAARVQKLRSTLAVYRMVFGQPRQEDLLGFLLDHTEPEQAEAIRRAGTVCLAPVGEE